MKKHTLFIVIITAGLLFGQNIPDYRERSLFSFSDSLHTSTFISQATEGIIKDTEYLVGPGDKLFISISGLEDINFAININHEGMLYIPKVGVIDLRRLTLKEAHEKIKNSVLKFYKNVDVSVLLLELRKIKVTMLGDVVKPGIFVFPANARLFDLIMTSKGLNETSDLRDIKITSNDEIISHIDILSFLRFADKKNNPPLHEGDIIFVSKYDETVFLGGDVFYPGTYEFKEGESVAELIKLAGGLMDRARRDSIEIVSFTKDGYRQNSSYYTYEEIQKNKILLKKYDNVLIRKVPKIFENRFVLVSGMAKYPGYYKIKKDSTTLLDIIKEAGGVREDASLTEASLFRTSEDEDKEDPEFDRLKIIAVDNMTEDEYDYFKAKSRQKSGRLVVDFYQLLIKNDLSENVILKKDDIITFPEAKNYITLLGQVVNPGNIIYQEDLTIDDYIALSGGFGWRALEGDVRVIKAKTGEWIDADDVETLQPGDTIWIPEDPPGPKFWTVFTTTLAVLGQVAAVIAATVAVIIATK